MDSQIDKEKLQRKIDRQRRTIDEKTKQVEKLQRQLKAMQNKNEKLCEELLISKTTPSLNVIILIIL